MFKHDNESSVHFLGDVFIVRAAGWWLVPGVPHGPVLLPGLVVVGVLNELEVHLDQVISVRLLQLVAAVQHHLGNVGKFSVQLKINNLFSAVLGKSLSHKNVLFVNNACKNVTSLLWSLKLYSRGESFDSYFRWRYLMLSKETVSWDFRPFSLSKTQPESQMNGQKRFHELFSCREDICFCRFCMCPPTRWFRGHNNENADNFGGL